MILYKTIIHNYILKYDNTLLKLSYTMSKIIKEKICIIYFEVTEKISLVIVSDIARVPPKRTFFNNIFAQISQVSTFH